MCTVSFIPVKDQVFITSNRDEKFSRDNAWAPAIMNFNDKKIICPKDGNAGGTWIAMKENGDAVVLLNGAFVNHTSQPPYQKSRGIILLEIFSADSPSFIFTKTDLYNIEPFTIVLFEAQSLYELRWNGSEKFYRQISADLPHIWSSATLYDAPAIKKREQWFAGFLIEKPIPTQQDILHFHQAAGDNDTANNLLMARQEHSTVSITGIQLTKNRGVMEHIDLRRKKSSSIKIELLKRSPAAI